MQINNIFMKVAHLEVLLETCVFSVSHVMMLRWDCEYVEALVLYLKLCERIEWGPFQIMFNAYPSTMRT